MSSNRNPPLERLRHHVTGAIERGEATAIVAVTSPTDAKTTRLCDCGFCLDGYDPDVWQCFMCYTEGWGD